MSKYYNPGTKVNFQNVVYTVVADEGGSLIVRRAGQTSNSDPISIPKHLASPILQEGRTPFNPNKRLYD